MVVSFSCPRKSREERNGAFNTANWYASSRAGSQIKLGREAWSTERRKSENAFSSHAKEDDIDRSVPEFEQIK